VPGAASEPRLREGPWSGSAKLGWCILYLLAFICSWRALLGVQDRLQHALLLPGAFMLMQVHVGC